jgi:hypothetical protein
MTGSIVTVIHELEARWGECLASGEQYPPNGKLVGPSVLALKKGKFLAFARRLLLYLDLREARYFCRVSIMAK